MVSQKNVRFFGPPCMYKNYLSVYTFRVYALLDRPISSFGCNILVLLMLFDCYVYVVYVCRNLFNTQFSVWLFCNNHIEYRVQLKTFCTTLFIIASARACLESNSRSSEDSVDLKKSNHSAPDIEVEYSKTNAVDDWQNDLLVPPRYSSPHPPRSYSELPYPHKVLQSIYSIIMHN